MTAECGPPLSRIWNASGNCAHALVDISTGGSRVLVSEELRPGDRMTVKLTNTADQRSLRVWAEVRWQRPLPSPEDRPRMYVVGLRFARTRGLIELLRTA